MAGYPVHRRATPRRRCSWRATSVRRLARPHDRHVRCRQRRLHEYVTP